MDSAHIRTLMLRFIAQRSGLDALNYADRESLLEDYRQILRDGRHARIMLRGIPPPDECFELSSGRLTLSGGELSYTTGQYFPTEYRAAACRAIATAWWNHWRADYTGDRFAAFARTKAKAHFGRAIADRWFK